MQARPAARPSHLDVLGLIERFRVGDACLEEHARKRVLEDAEEGLVLADLRQVTVIPFRPADPLEDCASDILFELADRSSGTRLLPKERSMLLVERWEVGGGAGRGTHSVEQQLRAQAGLLELVSKPLPKRLSSCVVREAGSDDVDCERESRLRVSERR